MTQITSISQLSVGDILTFVEHPFPRPSLAKYVYARNWRIRTVLDDRAFLQGLSMSDNTRTVERTYVLTTKSMQYTDIYKL